MASYKYIIKEKDNQNWLKGSLALKITKAGLRGLVEGDSRRLQQEIHSSVLQALHLAAGTTCSQCLTENLLQCPTMGLCSHPRNCKYHNTPWKKHRPCPSQICDIFRNDIRAFHRYSGPSWKNTKADQWCVKHWQVAKCFMPPDNYHDVTSYDETDFTGIISVMINCTEFQRRMSFPIDNTRNALTTARLIGRTIRHSPDLKVTDTDLADCFATMNTLLTDSKFLANDKDAQQAVIKLQQLEKDALPISTEDVMELLEDVMMQNRTVVIKGKRKLEDATKTGKSEPEGAVLHLKRHLEDATKTGKTGKSELEGGVWQAESQFEDATKTGKSAREGFVRQWKRQLEDVATTASGVTKRGKLEIEVAKSRDDVQVGERELKEALQKKKAVSALSEAEQREEAEGEISISSGTSLSAVWPSFVHHCTQVKEIWVQYHKLLSQFGLRLNADTLHMEMEYLSKVNKNFVNFAFVGLTPTESSSIAKTTLNKIFNDGKLATIFDLAGRSSKFFEAICSQNRIAPLVIITHVNAEKSALLYAEKYRYAIKLERECVVVVVCENKSCNHSKIDLNRLIAYTCNRNATDLQKEISILLKRWAYRILAERINTMKILLDSMKDCQRPTNDFLNDLSEHEIEMEKGAMQDTDGRKRFIRKLKELFEESRSLYSRNHIPSKDFPEFPPVLEGLKEKMLTEISKSDYVVGCGDRFGTLLVLIDEEVENRQAIEAKLESILNIHELDFEFKYVSKGLRYFLKSGETVNVNNGENYGTLAGFAFEDKKGTNDKCKVFALLSRHVALCCSNSKLKVEEAIVGDILESDDGCIDIAAAEIYSNLAEACDNKFVTEENMEKTSVTFDPYADDIDLSGTLVHLVGAASVEIGLGKITATKFHLKQAQGMKTFLLENRASNEHVFCEPGDSGAMILSYLPDDDKLLALGMLIGSHQNKTADTTDEFANPFRSNRKKHRATLVADETYAAFYLQDGLNELSTIHDTRFRLLGEHNHTYSCKKSEKCDGAFAIAGEHAFAIKTKGTL